MVEQSSAGEFEWILRDEADTVELGFQLGTAISDLCLTIYLYGDLGAGKTTLCRGIVRHFGHEGAVKSPTYTLVEPYELPEKSIFHFDLYRVAAADELSFLGLDEYFDTPNNLCLVEWPERGEGVLPAADLSVYLNYSNHGAGRSAKLVAHSDLGRQCLARLANARTVNH